jgi:hypothetical protein
MSKIEYWLISCKLLNDTKSINTRFRYSFIFYSQRLYWKRIITIFDTQEQDSKILAGIINTKKSITDYSSVYSAY